MKYTYIFWDRQNNLSVRGTSEVPFNEARTHAFFCTTCGIIWARVAAEDSPDGLHEVHSVPCEYHTPQGAVDWSKVPGSILYYALTKNLSSAMSWSCTLDYLPDALVEREFYLHLKWFANTLEKEYEKSIYINSPLFGS